MSLVIVSEDPSSSLLWTSWFRSNPRRSSSTFSLFTSKPTLPGNLRANAIATGRPTYPRPMTAIFSCMLLSLEGRDYRVLVARCGNLALDAGDGDLPGGRVHDVLDPAAGPGGTRAGRGARCDEGEVGAE